MERELLKQRLLLLTDDQVKQILENFKYLPEIEILPDLIIGKDYYIYNNGKGEYEVKFTLEIPGITDKMIIKNDTILVTHKEELILLNRENPSKSRVIFNGYKPREFVYYNDDIILAKYNEYIEALEYKNGKVTALGIKIKLDPGIYFDLHISQNNVILVGKYSLYRFDIEKRAFILIKEDKKSRFVSIGRKNKILRQIDESDEKYSVYLYDADTDSNTLLSLNINPYNISEMGENHVIMNHKLYRYDEVRNDLILISPHDIYNTIYLSNSLYYDNNPDERVTKLLKSTNLMLDYKLIKEFNEDYDDIVSIPLSRERLKKKYNDYRELIPMVNTNIKNIVLEFCRGDI